MKSLSWKELWNKHDEIKRELYDHLRNEIRNLQRIAENEDWTFGQYRNELEKLHSSIHEKWKEIEREISKLKDPRGKPLSDLAKGWFYEVLFYYACLKKQNFYMDAEIAERHYGAEFDEMVPTFEATPLFAKNPVLYQIQGKRKAPQMDADFLITFMDEKGPRAPALVDVKSSEPYPSDDNRERWGWQVAAATRRGFTFQLAYPKKDIDYPKSLKDWEVKALCPDCGNLSDNFRDCDECRRNLIPFTIVDAYHEFRWL